MAKAPDMIPGNPAPDSISGFEADAAAAARRAYTGLTPVQQGNLAPGGAPTFDRQISQSLLSSRATDEFDRAQEARFQQHAQDYPPNVAMEARRYWIAKPHLDFDHIAKNLAEVRAQIQAENFPWDVAKEQHPVLEKYLSDPSTASLAMQDSAMLTGADRWLGGLVQPIGGPVIKTDPTTGKPFDATPLQAAPPFWAKMAIDAFTKDVPAMAAGIARMASDVMDAALPDTHVKGIEDSRKFGKKFWDQTYARLSRETTGTKDYLGPSPEGSWHTPERMARSMETGVGFVMKNLPLLAGSIIGGGAAAAGEAEGLASALAHTKGVLMFNTVYSAADLYPKLKDATGSTGIAAGLTLAGAPVMGKIMGWSPVANAAGARMYGLIEDGVGRAAANALESESWRRLARISVMKAGVDFYVGKLAFAAQGATGAMIEQTGLRLAGMDTDPRAVYHAAAQGWEDGNAAALMSLYGTGRQIVSDTGKMIRSREMARSIEGLRADIERATANDPAFREQALKETAAQPGRDRTFYLPLERYNEVLTKAGYDPREVAAEAHGDGGAAYDKAVADHAEHLPIPIEKMENVFTSKVKELAELARNEGSLNADVWSRVVAQKISDEFKAAFDAAVKTKPEAMSEGDKSIYDALTSFAKSDETVAQHMFATVKALETRHPTLTTQEIFDATFGKGGVYGPPPDRAGHVSVGISDKLDRWQTLPSLIYSHDKLPEKMRIDLDENVSTGERAWVVSNFDFPVEIYKAEGSREAIKAKYGGKGYATDVYLKALADAQSAGVAWVSGVVRTDATREMYARLRKYGIPFVIEKGAFGSDYYRLSAEALKSLDLNAIHQRRAELATPTIDKVKSKLGLATPKLVDSRGNAYGMAAPAEQALRLAEHESGIYDSKEWMQAFKDEQSAFGHASAIADMQRTARQRVEMAIKAGVRSQITAERQKFEAQARVEIQKDPAQRALHFFQTGELWGEDSRRPMLVDQEGKPLRLLAKEVDALMGPGAAEALKLTHKSLITEDPRKAVDVAAAANALGYEGTGAMGDPARRMLAGLRDALTDGQFVKQWADLKVQEGLRSDLLDNPNALVLRVMDSVQNEKVAGILLSRLRAMGDSLDPMRQARAKLDAATWEKIAHGVVLSKALGDLKPEQYVRAMKASSDRTLEALRKGDMGKAWDATEAQLLNHFMYKIARENEKSLGMMYSRLTDWAASDHVRSTMGKADPAYRNLFDALTGVLGITERTPGDGSLDAFKDAIAKNAQDVNLAADVTGGWSTEVVQTVLSGERKWEDLRPAEAAEVFKAIKNIQHVAKVQAESLKNARNAEAASLISGAERYLSGLAPDTEGPVLHGKNPIPQDTHVEAQKLIEEWKKQTAKFGWGGAYLDSPRVILGYLGKEIQTRIYGGFMDGRITESELLHSLYEPWKETQKVWENDPDFHKPLVGAEDSLRIPGLDGPLTKKYLIQMVKWLGSESGREKLLKGMGLNLDTVLEAAGRYLQPYELDAIQAEHKFFDTSLAPLKAAAWERRTGLPWEKVTPMGYEIKFGDGTTRRYEGGYYPIHWDKREGVSRQYIPVEPDRNSLYNPKVPDGSFKERTKFVGVPDLNWANVPAHLLADVHNLAFGDFVQDANRVLLNPQMQNVMHRHLGIEYAQWARAWLERVAGENSGSVPVHLAETTRSERYSRSALITGALGLNLPLLMGDMAHPMATAAIRDGMAMSVTYAAPSMARVIESATNAAITGADPLRDEILSKSKIAKLREDELPSMMSRWFHGTYERGAEPGFLESFERVRDTVHNVSFWHLRISDGLVTRMIWDAKYRYTLDKTGDEMLARKEADDQVLASMPDYSVMAVPSILAEKGTLRALTLVFHSYWSKLLEMSDEQRHALVIQPSRAGAGKVSNSIHAAQWAGRTLAMLTFAVAGGDFLQGRGPQEDEDAATWFMRKELAAPFKIFPYAGTLAEPSIDVALRATQKRAQDVRITIPAFAVAERAMNAINALSDGRKPDADKVFGLAQSALMIAGLPATAPARAARYGYELGAGHERPRGALDVASGFTHGKRFGRSERFQAKNLLTAIEDIFEKGK